MPILDPDAQAHIDPDTWEELLKLEAAILALQPDPAYFGPSYWGAAYWSTE